MDFILNTLFGMVYVILGIIFISCCVLFVVSHIVAIITIGSMFSVPWWYNFCFFILLIGWGAIIGNKQ